MEMLTDIQGWIAGLALSVFLCAALVMLLGYGYRAFRKIGWAMVVIGLCFVHAMATKPIQLSKKSVTATNLVFDVACTNTLVGEFGRFYYTTSTGNDLVDADQVPTAVGNPFLIPSTNFTHTINGCYIWGGIDRNFYIVVESTNSNSQAVSGGTN